MESNPHIISHQMHLDLEALKNHPIGDCGLILQSISKLRMTLQKENYTVRSIGKTYSGIPEILEISADIKHFISRTLRQDEKPTDEERKHAEAQLEKKIDHYFSIAHH